MGDIEVGNIVRLKKDFECTKGESFVNIISRAPLQVISDGVYRRDKEFCVVTGDGFSLGIECDDLIKVKERGTIPTTLLPV